MIVPEHSQKNAEAILCGDKLLLSIKRSINAGRWVSANGWLGAAHQKFKSRAARDELIALCSEEQAKSDIAVVQAVLFAETVYAAILKSSERSGRDTPEHRQKKDLHQRLVNNLRT